MDEMPVWNGIFSSITVEVTGTRDVLMNQLFTREGSDNSLLDCKRGGTKWEAIVLQVLTEKPLHDEFKRRYSITNEWMKN